MLIVGLTLAAILGGFAYMLIRFWTPWKRLSDFPEARYCGRKHEPDVQLLALCLHQTIQLLGETKWGRLRVAEALRDVHLYVMDTDSWVDEFGRKVAGIQSGQRLFIGRNLAAFLHECAHRCEEVIDRERDMEHATWDADGIRSAESEFDAWLLRAHAEGHFTTCK